MDVAEAARRTGRSESFISTVVEGANLVGLDVLRQLGVKPEPQGSAAGTISVGESDQRQYITESADPTGVALRHLEETVRKYEAKPLSDLSDEEVEDLVRARETLRAVATYGTRILDNLGRRRRQ